MKGRETETERRGGAGRMETSLCQLGRLDRVCLLNEQGTQVTEQVSIIVIITPLNFKKFQ